MELFRTFELDGSNAGNYAGFTYAPYRMKLDMAGRDTGITAVGAEAIGSPVGLALAEVNDGGIMSIISVIVDDSFRSRGVGSELVSKVEEIALGKGVKKIVAEYAAGKPYTSTIEHIFGKKGWSPTGSRSTVYRCSSKGRGPEEFPWWLNYEVDGLSGEILQWKDVAEADLLRLRDSGWLPRELSPFITERMIDCRYSLALKINGEISGWIVYHKIRKDTTVCRSLFLREDLRDKGFAPLMVIKSVKLQYEDGIENFMFTILDSNEYVLPMVRRWMARYIVSSVEWRQTGKILRVNP